jgi:hypothetical protein
MGVLPLQFKGTDTAQSLGIKATRVSISWCRRT